MAILGFRPKLIPTLFTIPALILLLSLSIWQFQRLQWKQGIIDKINQQSQVAAIELPKAVDLPEMLYRKVSLKGKFLHEHEMHMYGGSRKFKGEVGYYILTPMLLKDNRVIIVNRGWVSEKMKDKATRPKSQIKGEVEISGSIMKTEDKSLYIHDNQLEKNLWFYINLDEMRSFIKLPIENFYILAKDDPNSMLRGQDLSVNLHNRHLGYALTWLFSAIALMLIYVIYHRKSN